MNTIRKIESFIAYLQPPAPIKTALVAILIGAFPTGLFIWRTIYFPIGNYSPQLSRQEFEAMLHDMAEFYQSPALAFIIVSLFVLFPLFCFFFGYLVLVLIRLLNWGWQQWIRKS